jgi:hypothetical protein
MLPFTIRRETVTRRAALAAKVQGLLDSAPDFVFQPAAEVRELGDLGLLR